MSREKTEAYYRTLTEDDLCSCDLCIVLRREIASAYPYLASLMDTLGVDIRKPFEVWPVGPLEDGRLFYPSVQYVVIGSREGFEKKEIRGVTVDITDTHPMTDIEEEHFVIEASPIFIDADPEEGTGKDV